MQRAIVLTIKGGRTGQVCASCARLGWLLVMGDDSPTKSKPRKRRAFLDLAHPLTPGEIAKYLRSARTEP